MSLHIWFIRTDRHTILVDTCVGNHKTRSRAMWNDLNTPWLDRLSAAGVEPEAVDFVLCTHLHTDHVGWNTRLADGRWVPTFPNAQYLFSKTDYDSSCEGNRPATALYGAYTVSALPIVEPGRAEMLDGDHASDDRQPTSPAPAN